MYTWKLTYIRGPFAKFVDSPYYSVSELCGGAVTVSFSKYLPWQAMQFLQRSTHFSITCRRPMITSKFLASELPFQGWMGRDLNWILRSAWKSGSVEPHQNIRYTVQMSLRAITGLFQPWKGSSEARNFEVINGLQHVFGKWVERSKKCITCQGKYFEEETVTKFRLGVIRWVHQLCERPSCVCVVSSKVLQRSQIFSS
jgi:hypothetical protein